MKRIGFLIWIFLAGPVDADLVTFEGNDFPENVGWERISFLEADRTLDEGWFVQSFDRPGEQDFYRRGLGAFAGVDPFFVEWRVQTNAPMSLLDENKIPVVVVAGGHSGAFYHTTMTDERVQLFRDTSIPLVIVEIEPGLPHTYRLELYGPDFFAWQIDGVTVESGAPQGAYPGSDSRLTWGAEYHPNGHAARWDYVRYGLIPEPGTTVFLLPGAACFAWWRRRTRG